MSLIFRKNATKNEKYYTVVMFTVISSSVYGVLSGFQYKAAFGNSPVTWGTILGISFIFWLPLLFDTNPGNKSLHYGAITKVVFHLCVYIIYVLFFYAVICFFIPFLYTEATGNPFERTATVTKMSDSLSRSCNIRIYLDLFEHQVCVSRKLYSSLNIGDDVSITGKESQLGYSVNSILKTD